MKTRFFYLTIIIVCSVLYSCSLYNDKTKYIVVMQSYGRANPKMINAAVLVTDKSEIEKDRKVFLPILDRNFSFLCGYDYEILFWNNIDSLSHEVRVNQSCENEIVNNSELNCRINQYAKQINTAPLWFIYNVEIPATMEPEEFREKTSDSDFLFFFFEPSSRYQSVCFEYFQKDTLIKNTKDLNVQESEKALREKAEMNIKDIIRQVSLIQAVKYDSTQFMTAFISYNSFYERICLNFENGVDLSKVVEIIRLGGGEEIKVSTPSVYYVQLVDRTNNIEKIKQKLKAYKFIGDVYLYPRSKFDPDYDGNLREVGE